MKERQSEELSARAVEVMPAGNDYLDFADTCNPLPHGHTAPRIVAAMRHAEPEGADEVKRDVE